MGLPEVKIAFKKAANTGVTQGEVGIVCVPVFTDAATEKIKITNYTDIDNLSAAYEPYRDLLKLVWTGQPNAILLYNFVNSTEIAEVLAAFESVNADLLMSGTLVEKFPDEKENIVTWVKDLRDSIGKKLMVIGTGFTSANYEGVVNIDPNLAPVKLADGEWDSKQVEARLTGAVAGLALTQAPTYYILDEVVSIPVVSRKDVSKVVDSGKLTLMNDGESIKIARGVTSLTDLTSKPYEYSKIKTMRILDKVNNDISKTLNKYYIGKVGNSYSDKLMLTSEIAAYFETLETNNLLDSGKNSIEIDIEAQRAYLVENGTDVTDMTEQEIKEANTRDKVFLKGNLKPVDAMEDITIEFYI